MLTKKCSLKNQIERSSERFCDDNCSIAIYIVHLIHELSLTHFRSVRERFGIDERMKEVWATLKVMDGGGYV